MKTFKKRKCSCGCGVIFTPERPLQKCHTYHCALIVEQKKRLKRAKKEKKEYRAETRRMKEKIKTLTEYLNEAQKEFNKYIRLRDRDEPCISCGTMKTNLQYHASHYRSVGACSSLRFNELNVHKSCSVCNNHKSGNISEYRIELCKKIGVFNVEWIESQPKMHRWTVEDAKEIKLTYRKKIKEIEKTNENIIREI